MNCWLLLFIVTLLLYLFYEYVLYVRKQIRGLLKDYKKLKKAEKELKDMIDDKR